MEECTDILEVKSSKGRSIPAIVIGSVCGIVASTAAGWFLGGYAPKMDTQAKTMIMKVGVGLMSGSIGTIVANDISNQVDDTVDSVKQFKEEVEELRKRSGKKGVEVE